MSANDRHSELDSLLRKLSDGELQSSDAARLNDLLRGDPGACERYLDHVALEAGLEREFGGAQEGRLPSRPQVEPLAPSAAGEPPLRFPRWPGYALAACVALAATLLWQNWPSTTAPGAATLATVLFSEDCVWKTPHPPAEGERLAAGKLHLASGTAVLRFDGGAEAVLRGDTALELHSAQRARLLGGEVVIRAEDGAEGFQLLTPASELTDLGTEFAVAVRRTGVTELQVLDGRVSYDGEVVDAGHALRLQSGRSAEPMPLTSARFADLVKQAAPKERRDLMTHYDGFFYDEGSYAPAALTKGHGWAGPWRLRQGIERRNPAEADSTDAMRIVHGALQVPWPIPGGRLGALEMPGGRSFRLRPMQRGIEMAQDGITYFSLITYEPDIAARNRAQPQEGVRLTFRSSADYWGESLSFGHGPNLRPQIQTGTGGKFGSPSPIADEQSLLWIGKIIRRADGEDEVFFRIYGQRDALDYAEPASWHASTRGLRQDAVLDLVILSSTGQSPRILDELRIGPTWRSVVPINVPFIAVK